MSFAIATHPPTHAAPAHVTTTHATTAQRKRSTSGRRRAYATMTILSGMTLPAAWVQHAVLSDNNTLALQVGLSASELLVVVLLIAASYTDMRWQKIYNWAIYPVLAWSAVIACLHSLGPGNLLSVFKYIDLFYNRKRIHQALGYVSPEQYEADHAPATKVA